MGILGGKNGYFRGQKWAFLGGNDIEFSSIWVAFECLIQKPSNSI